MAQLLDPPYRIIGHRYANRTHGFQVSQGIALYPASNLPYPSRRGEGMGG